MKALRYLLSMIAVVSVLSVSAQTFAQQPEARMQSTSVMVGSGSSLPCAAVNGAYVTGSTPGSYSPANVPTRPRREDKDGDGFEDEEENSNIGEPFPLGDAAWPLAVLALSYMAVRVARRRKSAMYQ